MTLGIFASVGSFFFTTPTPSSPLSSLPHMRTPTGSGSKLEKVASQISLLIGILYGLNALAFFGLTIYWASTSPLSTDSAQTGTVLAAFVAVQFAAAKCAVSFEKRSTVTAGVLVFVGVGILVTVATLLSLFAEGHCVACVPARLNVTGLILAVGIYEILLAVAAIVIGLVLFYEFRNRKPLAPTETETSALI
jgi:hypothetical protein